MRTLSVIFFAASLCLTACNIEPRNSLKDCSKQCKENKNPGACEVFCDCIHNKGEALNKCLDEYDKAAVGKSRTP